MTPLSMVQGDGNFPSVARSFRHPAFTCSLDLPFTPASGRSKGRILGSRYHPLTDLAFSFCRGGAAWAVAAPLETASTILP